MPLPLSAEVFNVIAQHIKRALAIGASPALHLLQLLPNLSLISGRHIVPMVMTMLIIGETSRLHDICSIKFLHALFLPPGEFS